MLRPKSGEDASMHRICIYLGEIKRKREQLKSCLHKTDGGMRSSEINFLFRCPITQSSKLIVADDESIRS